MKKLIALILVLCMTLSLAACGSGSAPAETAPQGESTEKTDETAQAPAEDSGKTLVVDIWDNNQLEGLQKIADEWTEQSGVKVDINVNSWRSPWTAPVTRKGAARAEASILRNTTWKRPWALSAIITPPCA